MNKKIDNFKGEHKIRNIDGNIRVYYSGDVVSKNGKLYITTRNTRGFSPEHGADAGWEEYGTNSSYTFTSSDIQPEISNEGDFWFNLTSGVLYVYVKDKDTEQWIEV